MRAYFVVVTWGVCVRACVRTCVRACVRALYFGAVLYFMFYDVFVCSRLDCTALRHGDLFIFD